MPSRHGRKPGTGQPLCSRSRFTSATGYLTPQVDCHTFTPTRVTITLISTRLHRKPDALLGGRHLLVGGWLFGGLVSDPVEVLVVAGEGRAVAGVADEAVRDGPGE